ncbi:MAG: NAD(P)/FAD-dependent oxidoreductase [Saprospiraceae bacterium]|nr:NAD(P)/FAD-dependent oxidoreductase [Saprospiraceae bacterium]
MTVRLPNSKNPRVVIIGAGFGGMELAKKLRNSPFQVILLDKNNYHNFQPLLYQVATGGLEPDSIAYPIRKVFRGVKNVSFRMAEVQHIDAADKCLHTNIGKISYDYLVIASGSKTNYFNFESISDQFMPLKSVPDALNLRSFILQNFEEAISSVDSDDREELINIAIVGAGPTGVELAGALGEMKKYIFPKDYPELDLSRMRILLFEAADRVLGVMSEEASKKAEEYVRQFEVEIYLNTVVSEYADSILTTKDGQTFRTDTIIWTAGVQGNQPKGLDPKSLAKGNRILVNSFNQVSGYADIFAIGDIGAMISEATPKGHPMVAPVAMQQADLLAKNLVLLEAKKPLKEFVYKDKGSMATIGRNRAVVDLPNFKFQGFFAWWVWMFVHIISLIGFRNKLATLWGWAYNYLTYDRAMRLIIRPYKKQEFIKMEEEGNPN